MDCVRASDFPGGSSPVGGMQFVEELQKSAVTFPRAASVAPWTIPAHASIFTGLYPWNHGAHAKRNLVLDKEIRRLPEMLREDGYRTISLSANPFISATFNLDQGFDTAAWGGWSESFLRLRRTEPPEMVVSGRRTAVAAQSLATGSMGAILRRFMHDAYRFPMVLDGANRLAQRIIEPQLPQNQSIATWIEPTFERWMTTVPSSQPLFAFVNLVDAHEPYYPVRSPLDGAFRWYQQARIRQDQLSFVAGRWIPDPADLDALWHLYRSAIVRLDLRLKRLVELLKAEDRWENTLFILTSDHGQAFGEHGLLFHMFRPDEPELRIPLVVRFPHDVSGGARGQGWASLVDLAPTVCQSVGLLSDNFRDGVPLQSLVSADRVGPILAMADGLIWDHIRARFEGAARERLDHIIGVAYEGKYKALFDVSSRTRSVYDIESDPGERSDISTTLADRGALLIAMAEQAGQQIGASDRRSMSSDVEERLRSWGYI
ncbi:MAG: sulfatase-like hydrolase/transferase [Thermoplasmata archaeon]|nr:sulfatase-like hydrolase/transferase [Thermoplasmata archaeon]